MRVTKSAGYQNFLRGRAFALCKIAVMARVSVCFRPKVNDVRLALVIDSDTRPVSRTPRPCGILQSNFVRAGFLFSGAS